MVSHCTETDSMCVRYAARLSSVSSNLASHRYSHTGERHFTCGIRHRPFTRHDTLRHHLYTQTEEWPVQCELCSKGFYNHNSLESHEHVRLGQTPFRCEACNKYFSQTMYLSTHTLIHTGQKMCRFQKCKKFVAQSQYLSSHMPTILNLWNKYRLGGCEKMWQVLKLESQKKEVTGSNKIPNSS